VNPKYDIFLVAAPKDQNKLPYVLKGIKENLFGYQNVYLCTPKRLSNDYIRTLPIPVHCRIDQQVLPATPMKWKHRPNWVYQQFIKLFQNETENDWVYIVDCDTIINKPLPLFEGSKPIWYVGNNQNHPPYFKFQKKLLGIGKVYDHTFLADMWFFSKKIIKKMLLSRNQTVQTFLENSYKLVSQNCYPSESELYMSYVYKNFPDKYVIKHLKTKLNAKKHSCPMDQVWTNKEIQEQIDIMKDSEYDTFSIHSWCNNTHNEW